MKKTIDPKTLFNPDQAILPILIASWDGDPKEATILYQNDALSNKIGLWRNKSLLEFLNSLCEGNGEMLINKLISDGELTFPCKTDDMDLKYHSFMGTNYMQITITDITELNKLRDIEQRSNLIDTFIMIGSHELKTPLNGILGIASLLKEEELSQDKRELLDVVINAATTLDGVVKKMLKQIYSEQTDVEIVEIENINIGSEIEKSMSLFIRCLKDRDFDATNVQLLDMQSVRLPKGSFNDILFEIAINLRRNTPPTGKVSIKSYDKDGFVYLEVENQGTGIPEEDILRVFEPFFHHQNSMHHSSGYEYEQSGVGMGLTILKRIVNNANGRVWFENLSPYEEGKENTVKLSIVLPSFE